MTDHSTYDYQLFLLDGTLTELHTEVNSEDLLRQVIRHYKEKSLLTGLGTAVGDLFGQAASSAMLAMYDGEYTENFICLIHNEVVCGTFGGASKLPEGGRIKAIVSRQGNILVAHAMLDEQQGFAWIKHPWGVHAERLANFKLGSWLAIFTLACFVISDFFLGPFMPELSHIEFTALAALASSSVCLVVGVWSNSDMKAIAGPATEVFRMLGFSNPEKINLNNYSYGIVFQEERLKAREIEHQYHDIYCYKKAIEDGKVKMLSS